MPSPFTVVAVVLAIFAVVFFAFGIVAIRRGRVFGVAASLVVALLLLTSAALCGTVSLSIRGYRALTREEVAAVVETRPTGPQSFTAVFRFPDGREKSFSLAGDQFYVDAHILKWKPLGNLLGLHTLYELDRVSGRYVDLEDEEGLPRTVFALSEEKAVDMFELRRRFPLFRPLVDAEYGSATFVLANRRTSFEVRVSTTGLLIRPVEDPTD
jgi:hypothetical protein